MLWKRFNWRPMQTSYILVLLFRARKSSVIWKTAALLLQTFHIWWKCCITFKRTYTDVDFIFQNYIEQVENETIFDLEKRLIETKNRLGFLVRQTFSSYTFINRAIKINILLLFYRLIMHRSRPLTCVWITVSSSGIFECLKSSRNTRRLLMLIASSMKTV